MTCCLNNTCAKKETCKRYKNEEYAIVNHKAICDEEYGYQWFWEDEGKIDKIKGEGKQGTINESERDTNDTTGSNTNN